MLTSLSNVTTYINIITYIFRHEFYFQWECGDEQCMTSSTLYKSGGYPRRYKHVCGTTEKWQERSLKEHNYNFFLLGIPNLGHLVNTHVARTENKLYHFSKRDLRADILRNKCLKEALQVII